MTLTNLKQYIKPDGECLKKKGYGNLNESFVD